MPPPSSVAELLTTVLFVRLTETPNSPRLLAKMPPPERAELPEIVLLMSPTSALWRTLASLKMPPPSLVAELPAIVLLVIVTSPSLPLAMPPPEKAELPATVLFVSVRRPLKLPMPPPELPTILASVSVATEGAWNAPTLETPTPVFCATVLCNRVSVPRGLRCRRRYSPRPCCA